MAYTDMFLKEQETKPYENFFKYNVEQPLQASKSQALKDVYRRLAGSGLLRSGVSAYPQLDIEKSYAGELNKAASSMAKEQAQAQLNIEEAAKTRNQNMQQFEKQKQYQTEQAELNRRHQLEVIQKQYDLQRQLIDSQKKSWWESALGTVTGGIATGLTMGAGGGWGTALKGIAGLFGGGSSSGQSSPDESSYDTSQRVYKPYDTGYTY